MVIVCTAALFTILQIFARVTSRCDLDLSPLDFELLWLFERHVFKLCAKFEQNRTIRCRVIDDLVIYFRVGVSSKLYSSEGDGLNSPKFGENIYSCIIGAPTPKLW